MNLLLPFLNPVEEESNRYLLFFTMMIMTNTNLGFMKAVQGSRNPGDRADWNLEKIYRVHNPTEEKLQMHPSQFV
jgi:hypothetical protein